VNLNNNYPHRQIYTVSELTDNIKSLLEDNFPFVWICGEISNFNIPVSGHYYFSLKDEGAQINAIMFRSQNRGLQFIPGDGMIVIGLGRVSVYEARGSYQIILEYLEPRGIGAIQIAFEQLKKKLSAEGLFKEDHKKPIPFLPRKINIITSPSGAAIHDILKIINRRFPNVHIEIMPVKVQGEGSKEMIVEAIELLNSRGDSDVAILARGGGSIEDLQVFNSEDVARAIFSSEIPIISAVGHETDFTIADFVADLRAPTPSAAAELVVPKKDELLYQCARLSRSLKSNCFKYVQNVRRISDAISKRLIDPRKKIQDLRIRIDDFSGRLVRIFIRSIKQRHERLEWLKNRLYANSPFIPVKIAKDKVEQIRYNMFVSLNKILDEKRFRLREQSVRLYALSPTAILARGYSITRTIPDAKIVKDSRTVNVGQSVEVMLGKGFLICRVKRKSTE
jgi:exodeoxyribonuclease VII large subunit